MREQHRAAITEQLGRVAGNGHRVLEALFDRPIVSVGGVQKLTGTSAVANKLFARMTELGVLREIAGFSRNRHYEPYVLLFTGDTEEQR